MNVEATARNAMVIMSLFVGCHSGAPMVTPLGAAKAAVIVALSAAGAPPLSGSVLPASWAPVTPARIYNEEEAILFMQYSRVSFCTQNHIEQWDCGDMCQEAPTVFGAGNVRFIGRSSDWEEQGYVARVPSLPSPSAQSAQTTQSGVACVVAFRGSVDIMNWVNDGEFWSSSWPDWPDANGASWCPNCEVHHGFASAYRELRPGMLAGIRALGCQRLAFTGHSAGAALATLASFEARATLGLPVDPVWTFGKPRVGDKSFVQAYIAGATRQGVDPPMWRVVHYHDPVARLPPNGPLTWITDYVHEPLEVYYPSRDSSWSRVCPSTGSNPESHDEACAYSTDVVECLGDPAFDHTTYLNMSTIADKYPKSCTSNEVSSPRQFFLAASPSTPRIVGRRLRIV